VAKFANLTNDSVWETLAQRLKIARICARRAGMETVRDRLQGPCYLSRDDHDRKIRVKKQRTDIGKYSGTSVHERPCSRTIRFTNKFSEQNVSDD
jgi:hypothetical protein